MSSIDDTALWRRAFKGNEEAVVLASLLVQVASTWDDLADGDKKVEPEALHSAMWAMLVSIPLNGFYRAHLDELQPIMQQSIINWHLSNTMEKSPGRAREIAHVTRYAVGDVLLYMAAIIGGLAHVREMGPELRMVIQREAMADYEKEMEAKHA